MTVSKIAQMTSSELTTTKSAEVVMISGRKREKERVLKVEGSGEVEGSGLDGTTTPLTKTSTEVSKKKDDKKRGQSLLYVNGIWNPRN